jgi:hypothetical protein
MIETIVMIGDQTKVAITIEEEIAEEIAISLELLFLVVFSHERKIFEAL